jgi:CheY-like chemotaxis protein
MTSKQSRGSVLVVDDDPDIGLFLSALLQDRGWRVACASDGQSGLELARELRPAVICLDINMPVRSGMSVFRALRADPELRAVPVVMVTGSPPEMRRFVHTRRRLPPPEAYVCKPFVPQLLVAAIERVSRERFGVN